MRRLILVALVIALLIPLGAWAGSQAENPVKVRVIANSAPAPKDDSVIKYAQSRNPATVDYIEWGTQAQLGDLGWVGLAQQRWTSGDLPDIWALGTIHTYGNWMDYISKQGMFKEITPDFLKKYMPNYVKAATNLGLPIETILGETKWKGDGKNWYIDYALSPTVFPKLLSTKIGQTLGAQQHVYAVYLRDDILKMLYPNAKTEADMKALYIKQNASLSVADLTGDLPIKDVDSLTAYMKAVKNLNLKVGDKPVIPGAINCSSESAGSIRWSIGTLYGLTYRWPLVYQEPPKQNYWYFTTDAWKAALKVWNGWYNDGLLDPELFVMKDDQYQAKAINGQYAIINHWLPVANARDAALQQNRGYGWRYQPIFYPLDMSQMQNWFNYDSIPTSDIWISSKIKDADLPGIMKWLDWQFSDEADSIQYWGLPDWYTGNGADRRYKADYNDLKQWAVYGISGAKDGNYYGLAAPNNIVSPQAVNYQPKIRIVSLLGSNAYQYSPTFVYPHNASEMGNITDIGAISENIITQDFKSKQRMFTAIGWQESDWGTMFDNWNSQMGNAPWNDWIVKMIVGKPADFDKTWTDYVAMQVANGVKDAEAAVAKDFLSKWPLIQKSEVKK